MAEITGQRKFIFDEEVRYKAGVSQSVGYKIARMVNFLGRKMHSEKQFFLNGPYSIIGAQNGVDGVAVFEFDAEIFNVWMFSLTKGISGTTELDLKIATTPGGSFTSIFSTTPKITSAAVNNAWIGIGGTVTGCTAAVLNGGTPYNVNAGTIIRLDKIQSMSQAENCGLLVHYRPR